MLHVQVVDVGGVACSDVVEVDGALRCSLPAGTGHHICIYMILVCLSNLHNNR